MHPLAVVADKLAKFRSIAEFNQLLLHRPWAITASHVASLVKPPSNESSSPLTSFWTIPDVVHAIAVLAHFHAVACIAHGCGVAPEIDDVLRGGGGEDGRRGEGGSRCSSLALADQIDHVDEVIDKMKSIETLTGPEMNADQKARVFQRLADEESEMVVETELLDGDLEGDRTISGHEEPASLASLIFEDHSSTISSIESTSDSFVDPLVEASSNTSMNSSNTSPPQHLLCVPQKSSSRCDTSLSFINQDRFARFLHGPCLRFIDFRY